MRAPVLHRAAGLTVAADRFLPGFVPAPGQDAADARVHLDAAPPWQDAPAALQHASGSQDAAGIPIVQVSRSAHGYHFQYADQTRFWIDASGQDVWCTWPPPASLDDTCTYLCGPVLGLLLRIRGALALHASAVRIGDAAIGFAGGHGAGKSTLAAALGAAGCGVVTDDVLHLRPEEARWVAEPFASMLKLWPCGAELALGPGASLPPIAAGWDKRALHLGECVAAVSDPLTLGAIAWLAPRGSDVAVEPLSPAEALVRLAAHSSAAHLLDSTLRAAEFRALSALVRSVPCVAVTPPAEAAAYPAFVARVLEWGSAPALPAVT